MEIVDDFFFGYKIAASNRLLNVLVLDSEMRGHYVLTSPNFIHHPDGDACDSPAGC